MENKEIAIQVKDLKKMYKLGQIGGGTLYGDLQSWWARVRGKEDPNSIVGSHQRSYGKTFMALNGIDVTIRKGEAVGIIGHNGAGKSTLLKLLSRVTAPTEGEIGINGRVASMLEVGTGFNAHMTGRENVYMNGAILGMTKAEVDAKMEQIIDFSEVREFIDTPVKRYSSGMYVKLAFSVAAHLDSEIMIMDEVLAVGDMAFQKKCLDKMREAATQEGRTVLYVSHNMNTIRQLCDRCIVMDSGKVVFDGDVETAIEQYLTAIANDHKNVYELADVERKNSMGTHITMERLEFLENPGDESVPFLLTIHSHEKIENLYLQSTVKYRDFTPVGTCMSQNLGEFHANQTRTVLLELNTKQFPKGSYMLTLEIGMLDDSGLHSYDYIHENFMFDSKYEVPIYWTRQWHGHVFLEPISYKGDR